MAKTDDIFINTFRKAFDDGEFVVTCRDASTAQHLRFRAYNFARQVKKDGEKHGALAGIASMVAAVSISLKANELTFIRKDKEGAMQDLMSALGEGGDTPYVDPEIQASFERAKSLASNPTTPKANVDTMQPTKKPTKSEISKMHTPEVESAGAEKYRRRSDPLPSATMPPAPGLAGVPIVPPATEDEINPVTGLRIYREGMPKTIREKVVKKQLTEAESREYQVEIPDGPNLEDVMIEKLKAYRGEK